MTITLTIKGIHQTDGLTIVVTPFASAPAELIRRALAATPRWARDTAPARMARATLAGRADQAAEIAAAQRAENAEALAFGESRVNRAAVALENARERASRARYQRDKWDAILKKIPGATALAADRRLAERRLAQGIFPALARKLAADDELASAEAALPAAEAEFAEAQALAAPTEIYHLECGVRTPPDGAGNRVVRDTIRISGLSTRAVAERLRAARHTRNDASVSDRFLRRVMRGDPPISADDPLVDAVRQVTA